MYRFDQTRSKTRFFWHNFHFRLTSRRIRTKLHCSNTNHFTLLRNSLSLSLSLSTKFPLIPSVPVFILKDNKSIVEIYSLAMDDAAYKERTAALLKVIQVKKILKDDTVPCQIEEGLYLGSLGAAHNRSALKGLNVTHILTVAHLNAPAHPNDFVYKVIEVPDREDVNLSPFFDECFAFIDEARASGGGVLVHCFAGRSRSVTIVVAYLMFKRGMSLSEAMEYVRMKRPTISPNYGFRLQLQEYERFLRGNKDGVAHEPEKSEGSLSSR